MKKVKKGDRLLFLGQSLSVLILSQIGIVPLLKKVACPFLKQRLSLKKYLLES